MAHDATSNSMTPALAHSIPRTSPVSTGMYSAGVKSMLLYPTTVGVTSSLPINLKKQRQTIVAVYPIVIIYICTTTRSHVTDRESPHSKYLYVDWADMVINNFDRSMT